MKDLEQDMIIEATVARLLNESEVRSTDTYHVGLEKDDTFRLTRVEKAKFGNYVPVDGVTPIQLQEDVSTWRLSEYKFIGFVKVLYQPDKERERRNTSPRLEMLEKIFEGISPELIQEFLKAKVAKDAD